MKRFLLAMLALAWTAASGQQNADETLAGLPQYGVTLGGTAQAPVVHNTSSRTVIYVILKLDYAEGPSTYRPVKVRVFRRPDDSPEGIPPGGVRTIFTDMPTAPVVYSGRGPLPDPPKPKILTGASLDAVIFSDGEFMGPDRGEGFDRLAKQFAAERELATLVAAARTDPTKREAAWAEVNRLRPGQPPTYSQPPAYIRAPRTAEDSLKMGLAQMLFYTLQRYGEAAAYEMAEREMMPQKLWRAAQ